MSSHIDSDLQGALSDNSEFFIPDWIDTVDENQINNSEQHLLKTPNIEFIEELQVDDIIELIDTKTDQKEKLTKKNIRRQTSVDEEKELDNKKVTVLSSVRFEENIPTKRLKTPAMTLMSNDKELIKNKKSQIGVKLELDKKIKIEERQNKSGTSKIGEFDSQVKEYKSFICEDDEEVQKIR